VDEICVVNGKIRKQLSRSKVICHQLDMFIHKKKKKIYLPKRLVARKGFSLSTLATIHTIKQK